ncbi:hypothetical protein CHS0354_032348 [Potamilus streckersoni]|uniref:Uncharacterized protein n=1 Tax=Potamilus streckersoni TaxID=2493646 RepID=A0AAE0WC85_9BIVA|nr:hypothetical protein CHS0354_032348 [Potamilus streckersoni]
MFKYFPLLIKIKRQRNSVFMITPETPTPSATGSATTVEENFATGSETRSSLSEIGGIKE